MDIKNRPQFAFQLLNIVLLNRDEASHVLKKGILMKKLLILGLSLSLAMSSAWALRFASPDTGLNGLNTKQLTERLGKIEHDIAALSEKIQKAQQENSDVARYKGAGAVAYGFQHDKARLDHMQKVKTAIENRLQQSAR